MSLSRSSTDSLPYLVADASGIINLNATGIAAEILKASPYRVIVTSNAVTELEEGASHGHRDAEYLQHLVASGLIKQESLSGSGLTVYEQLISGSTLTTLDDGEAATIGHALHISSWALLDERKARGICRRSFPGLMVISTAELLLSSEVSQALGDARLQSGLLGALRGARMRVAPEFIEQVRRVIGDAEAAACSSLPRVARHRK